MTTFRGADSASPQQQLYSGHFVWGVYVAGSTPHVWTRDEIMTLGRGGVRAVLPITVPTQDTEWWTTPEERQRELGMLAANSRLWGVPWGAPLCLDIEEAQAEAMTPQEADEVDILWHAIGEQYGYAPWIYGGSVFHGKVTDGKCERWLADWDLDPAVPDGYRAKQYAGGQFEGRIDLDSFLDGRYLGCDFQVLQLGNPDAVKAAVKPAEPAPTEAVAVADALSAQADAVKTAVEAPPSVVETKTITSLIGKIEVHLAEMKDLAAKERL